MRSTVRLLSGIALILLGVFFLGANFRLWPDDFWRWVMRIWDVVWRFWPLLLVYLGGRLLASRR